MVIRLGAEDTQDIIVFMDGLSKIASLLRVPPFGIRVSEGSFLRWRVHVSAVLEGEDTGG
jgi:hypothetical protein